MILGTLELSDTIFGHCYEQVQSELRNLCSNSYNSVLRQRKKEDLELFTWDILHGEFEQSCPHFLKFLQSSTCNPSAKKNKIKTSAHLKSAMCAVGAKMISMFNDDMSALRHINSILAKKSGLKKVGFIRMCATYDTMSYATTNRMFENYGKNHDEVLLHWKDSVEKDDQIEKNIIGKIQIEEDHLQLNPNSDLHYLQLESYKNELTEFQKQMHSGKN